MVTATRSIAGAASAERGSTDAPPEEKLPSSKPAAKTPKSPKEKPRRKSKGKGKGKKAKLEAAREEANGKRNSLNDVEDVTYVGVEEAKGPEEIPDGEEKSDDDMKEIVAEDVIDEDAKGKVEGEKTVEAAVEGDGAMEVEATDEIVLQAQGSREKDKQGKIVDSKEGMEDAGAVQGLLGDGKIIGSEDDTENTSEEDDEVARVDEDLEEKNDNSAEQSPAESDKADATVIEDDEDEDIVEVKGNEHGDGNIDTAKESPGGTQRRASGATKRKASGRSRGRKVNRDKVKNENSKGKEVEVKKPVRKRSPSTHPHYSEMISKAISAINDRTGSSTFAIMKYVEDNYSGLKPTWKTILKTRLKQLLESGELVKIKASYKLGKNKSRKHAESVEPAKSESPEKTKKVVTKEPSIKKPKVVKPKSLNNVGSRTRSSGLSENSKKAGKSPEKSMESPKKSEVKKGKSNGKAAGKSKPDKQAVEKSPVKKSPVAKKSTLKRTAANRSSGQPNAKKAKAK